MHLNMRDVFKLLVFIFLTNPNDSKKVNHKSVHRSFSTTGISTEFPNTASSTGFHPAGEATGMNAESRKRPGFPGTVPRRVTRNEEGGDSTTSTASDAGEILPSEADSVAFNRNTAWKGEPQATSPRLTAFCGRTVNSGTASPVTEARRRLLPASTNTLCENGPEILSDDMERRMDSRPPGGTESPAATAETQPQPVRTRTPSSGAPPPFARTSSADGGRFAGKRPSWRRAGSRRTAASSAGSTTAQCSSRANACMAVNLIADARPPRRPGRG